MFIKVLYVVLVLCTIALVGAVGAAYLKIRKHMRDSAKAQKSPLTEPAHKTEPVIEDDTR